MNLQSKLYGASSVVSNDGQRFSLIPASFLTHVLLFDEYTLQSNQLSELPQLVSFFSVDSVARLLESPWFRVDCSQAHLGILGNRSATPASGSVLSFGPYGCIHIRGDQHAVASAGMRRLDDALGRGSKISKVFRRTLAHRLVPPDVNLLHPALAQAKHDIASPAVVGLAIAMAASRILGRHVPVSDFSVDTEVRADGNVMVKSDVVASLALSPDVGLTIVDRAILGILGYNERLELVKVHKAAVAMRQGEEPFVEDRIAGLLAQNDPSSSLTRFHRLVSFAGLPDLIPGTAAWVDLDRLIEVRESEAGRAFRHWLHQSDDIDDKELAANLSTLRVRLGLAAGTTVGKVARLSMVTIGGLMPGVGLPLGIGLGILDQFVLERLTSLPAPLLFLGSKYPSIFDGGTR